MTITRRTLPALAVAAVLSVGLAACGDDPVSQAEDVAIKYVQADADGDGKTVCEMEAEPAGECGARVKVAIVKGPEVAASFENEHKETVGVVVDYTYENSVDQPNRDIIEVNRDGKVVNSESANGEAADEATVAGILEWSK